jgi:hypothetical protein
MVERGRKGEFQQRNGSADLGLRGIPMKMRLKLSQIVSLEFAHQQAAHFQSGLCPSPFDFKI